jgi:putative addiction module killer protein
LKLSKSYKVQEYITDRGASPYRRWLKSLSDLRIRARIQARILRLELGNFGDYRPIGESVNELRLDFGPGYRIYFGIEGDTLVLLLLGGDKSTQRSDIIKAKAFWQDYWRSKNEKK